MRCPHCGATNVPHIAIADVGLTEPQDEDVLTCLRCDSTSSYIGWLKDDIAAGKTHVTMEADASTGETQDHVLIELAIHRNADGRFRSLETVRSGLKSSAGAPAGRPAAK
jgi:hypothetical protein